MTDYPDSYCGPRLVFHGGLCCGIKTIHGFYQGPGAKVHALEKCNKDNSDQFGRTVSSKQRFFTDEAPEETWEERVLRYIEFCKKHRPKGVIEVVIACYQFYQWKEFLKKNKFKLVTSAVNSNTSNTIYIYHKKTGQPRKKKNTVVADPFAVSEGE